MSDGNILGLVFPRAGALFVAALAVHVLAALTCVVAGAMAASAAKRPGRHPRAGHVYLWGIAVVGASATVMAGIRWREDRYLFAIAVFAVAAAVLGWRARRRRRAGWVWRHAFGMGGSYIALFTGFYVDNGHQLPGWDRLPHWSYWFIPAAIGIPLIGLAIHRFFRAGISGLPPTAGPDAAPPPPRHTAAPH